MKVRELIKELEKFDKERDVVIRFVVSERDDTGYVLEPEVVSEYFENVGIYADYNLTEEDCAFMGQIDLAKLWEENQK